MSVGQEIHCMSDKYFADTNILVYAFDSRDPTKQAKDCTKFIRKHG